MTTTITADNLLLRSKLDCDGGYDCERCEYSSVDPLAATGPSLFTGSGPLDHATCPSLSKTTVALQRLVHPCVKPLDQTVDLDPDPRRARDRSWRAPVLLSVHHNQTHDLGSGPVRHLGPKSTLLRLSQRTVTGPDVPRFRPLGSYGRLPPEHLLLFTELIPFNSTFFSFANVPTPPSTPSCACVLAFHKHFPKDWSLNSPRHLILATMQS
jgi:hypothetical protein